MDKEKKATKLLDELVGDVYGSVLNSMSEQEKKEQHAGLLKTLAKCNKFLKSVNIIRQ